MPLSPSFAISQAAGVPSVISIEDTSSGSDVSVTQRRVYFQLADGSYLNQSGTSTDYEAWALADDSEDFDVLTTDKAVLITVQWLNVSNAVVYEEEQLYNFNQYTKQASIDLSRALASNPSKLNDGDYWLNRMKLRVNIDDSEQAVELAGDISLAQSALDRATHLVQNQSLYF